MEAALVPAAVDQYAQSLASMPADYAMMSAEQGKRRRGGKARRAKGSALAKKARAAKKASSRRKKGDVRTVGSYAQVYKGTARKTSGGLTKADIIRKSVGGGKFRYVSRRKSMQAKKGGNPALKAWSDALFEHTGSRRPIPRSHPKFAAVKRSYKDAVGN